MTLRQKVATLFASKNLKQRAKTGIILLLLAIATAIPFEGWLLRIALAGAMSLAALEIYTARIYGSPRKSTVIFDLVESLVIGVAVVFILFCVPSIPRIALFIVIAYGHDIAALFVGKLLGGKIENGQFVRGKLFTRQPFPTLSPKKTGEGCIGGIISSAILSFGFIYVANSRLGADFRLPEFILAGGGGVVALLGDLLGSITKRGLQLDDSGEVLGLFPGFSAAENLLAGHGGYLDRFDSLSLVVAVAAILQFALA